MTILFLSGVCFVLMILLRNESIRRGKAEAEKERIEEDCEAMSSRPLTDADFLNKLHNLAKEKRKDKRDT